MTQDIKADIRIGKNIQAARKARGLTQDALASQLQIGGIDISRGTVAKIESGIRHISITEIDGIRQILDMSYADFFA